MRCSSLPLLIIVLIVSGSPAPAQIVINEINYDAEPKTDPIEFVELHNSGTNSVDLTGWRFSDGIEFNFPSGTTLAPDQYLVVAENPAFLRTSFSLSASDVYGPYTNTLSNGELVSLRDDQDQKVDEVNYQSGFPWPTAASGAGSSMELIHPSLDNDLGGSWRSAGLTAQPPVETIFLAPRQTWRYREGRSEASSPQNAWRQLTFTEDASWMSGTTVIGYGDGDDTTLVTMQNQFSTLYFRHIFNVAAEDIPTQLFLRVYIDDGAVVWINGVEVARFSVPGGDLAYNALATNHEAAWEQALVNNAQNILNAGDNIIAVHGINGTLNSSDFSFDAELRTPPAGQISGVPSPASINSVFATNAPPQTRQVNHTPRQPRAGETVTMTAKATDPDGVSSMTLSYQVVSPGNYIRKTDSAYELDWINIPMNDAGINGDQVPGDDIFTAQVPGNIQVHRTLIRYRIRVEDSLGYSVQLPYADDDQPNFAYYCYNGVPAWTGADQPGGTPTDTFSAEIMNSLPVYHLIANQTDVNNSQYNGGFDAVRFQGTFVYDNVVYDHIQFRNRGEFSTYVSGKNKWRFYFNRTHDFEARDNYGRKYDRPQKTINFNACASPWIPVNRGFAGMEEGLGFKLNELAGGLASKVHWVHFRVVDDLAEAPADQYAGDLWGMYMFVEHTDSRFLDERGLPDGNTYKIEGSNGDKRNQGPTQSADSSDWNSFRNAYNGSQSLQWWRDNLDLPTYYTFRCVNRIISNVDIREGWNVAFYHHPDNHWYPIPWDLDMLIIPETHWQGSINLERSLSQHSILNIEFKNRARELIDLMFSERSPTGGQIGQFIDEHTRIMNPPGEPLTFADVDRYMWNYHPRTAGGHRGVYYDSPKSQGNRGGTWTRTLVSQDHEGMMQHLLDFMTDTDPDGWFIGDGDQRGYGFNYLEFEAAFADIPARPVLTYVGPPGFPVNELQFQSSPFNSDGNNPNFTGIQWRVAEIANPQTPGFDPATPWKYELQSVWEHETNQFTGLMTIPGSVVREGSTYRVRVRMRNGTMAWSRWSLPIEFMGGHPDLRLLQNGLVFNEIMYHPPDEPGIDGDELEFLEIKNVGPIELDLGRLFFSRGINFTFPEGALLAPGELFLLGRNPVAFQTKYPGVTLDGIYAGNLANGGETVTLSAGLGAPVLSVTYADLAPWPITPDGLGFSLIPSGEQGIGYKVGSQSGGSPGTDNPSLNISAIVINEALTSSPLPALDTIELYNPTDEVVDIGNGYLTDDRAVPMKFRIPDGTMIQPQGFLIFDELQFNLMPGSSNHFSLSSFGEGVYFLSGNDLGELTGYSHGFEFGPAESGVSFGRYFTSTGEEVFPPQSSTSFGSGNSGPKVGPVIINEIHYHPVNPEDEFVELRNLSMEAVSLFDGANPLNRWQVNGLGYTFFEDVTMQPDEIVVVTTSDPNLFRARNNVPAGVRVLGPAPGNLQDSGENLELLSPDVPTLEGVPYFAVDTVRYNDQDPWPFSADGGGPSLGRLVAESFGNDPTNWAAVIPTPGRLAGVGDPPVITLHPFDQTVEEFQSATFMVIATGENLQYQWRFNGTPISGETRSSLQLMGVKANDAGFYDVTVFNPGGAVISEAAQLSVEIFPEILLHPEDVTVTILGTPVNITFSVTAFSDTPITYQWYRDGMPLVTGGSIPTVDSPTLTVNDVQVSDTGDYHVVVSNSFGSVTSQTARLTVNARAMILLDSLGTTAPEGSMVSISATWRGSGPFLHRWRFGATRPQTTIGILNPASGFAHQFIDRGYIAASPTHTVLVITNLNAAWAGFYDVVVSNVIGQLSTADAQVVMMVDSDQDGLPDSWETGRPGFNVNDPTDGSRDDDGDGSSNSEEYFAGTDYLDAQSYLKVSLGLDGQTEISFQANAGRTYTVQYSAGMTPLNWQKLADAAAAPTDHIIRITDPFSQPIRVYRLVTPTQPD